MLFLVGACSQTTKIQTTDPCDVLVAIPTTNSTNLYLIENDRPAAIGLARHRGRLFEFNCLTKDKETS